MVEPRAGYVSGSVSEPLRLSRWVADHRMPVRIVLVGIDIAVVTIFTVGLVRHGSHWFAYTQLLVWASITFNVGWGIPGSVDARRRQQTQERSAPESAKADGS